MADLGKNILLRKKNIQIGAKIKKILLTLASQKETLTYLDVM